MKINKTKDNKQYCLTFDDSNECIFNRYFNSLEEVENFVKNLTPQQLLNVKEAELEHKNKS
ncbi:MAG: hypothetical protein PHG08_00920 [Bacilli bacterium]|nr:hypothetical protein [Bacilli bacterium]